MKVDVLDVTVDVCAQLTLIDNEAKFLDSSKIPTDPVDPVHLQTWKQKIPKA